MLMADTMAIFFTILGLLLAFPGLWLLCHGLWPQAVSKAATVCNRGLLKPFILGLPITVMMVLAAAILSNLGTVGKISAMALISFYLMFANSGLAGLVTCIGERLACARLASAPGTGSDNSPDVGQRWRATLRGGIVLELAYLLPILGWFVILPVSVTIGCGAIVMALFKTFFAPSGAALPREMQPLNAEVAGMRISTNLEAEP